MQQFRRKCASVASTQPLIEPPVDAIEGCASQTAVASAQVTTLRTAATHSRKLTEAANTQLTEAVADTRAVCRAPQKAALVWRHQADVKPSHDAEDLVRCERGKPSLV